MSEHPINDPQPTSESTPAAAVSAHSLASARRRRFIKLGGVAVPTALTLTSRPVMAWHCNTASMWGSVQGISTTHSSYGRSRVEAGVQQAYFRDETYTKTNWIRGEKRDTLPPPWSTLGVSSSKAAPWNSFANLKIRDVIPSPIAGVTNTQKIQSYLQNSSDEYGVLMVTAWLNYIALVQKSNASPGLGKCIAPQSPNALVWMGTPGVTGPDGKVWDKPRIIEYLKLNWIAVHS